MWKNRKRMNMAERGEKSGRKGCNRRDMLKASLLAGAGLLVGAPVYAAGAVPSAEHAEHASGRFLKSMNCSQAILETYAPSMGMSVETARRVAAAFAGGMGMGAECGAVTGAFMVIGMKYGKVTDKDAEADRKTFEKVAEFVKEFKARHEHTGCSALLGVDMATSAGLQEAEAKGLFTELCPKLVCSAAEILDKILV